MKTKVEVTAELIETGIPQNASSCPIAKALKPHLKPYQHAVVKLTYFNIEYLGDAVETYKLLPKAARDFIRTFDSGAPVEPFDFEIEL